MAPSTRVKFLDPSQVEEAIGIVAEAAREAGVELAIIGGVAMAVYGSDRMTADLDVATAATRFVSPVMRPSKTLSFGGFSTTLSNGCPVDVVVRDDDYWKLYVDAVDRAVDVGIPLRVVTREHLAALKMAAARPKDVLDLKTLVSLGELDLVAARKIVTEHLGPYAARELDALVAETLWEKSREEKT